MVIQLYCILYVIHRKQFAAFASCTHLWIYFGKLVRDLDCFIYTSPLQSFVAILYS